MNRNMTIDVSELAKSTITRERGNGACQNLEKIIKDNSPNIITIDLTKSDMISLSFLDGLIVNIKKNLELEKVQFYFVIKNEEVIKKLRKVITLRNFKGYYRYVSENSFKEIEKVDINLNIPTEVVKNKELMIQV